MLNPSQSVKFMEVELTSGFWAQKQKLIKDITIGSIYQRFYETGRFVSLKMEWTEGKPNKPHIFWDSDIAKWVESAAYLIQKNYDPELEKIVDDIIDTIASNQDVNGYFNTYFTVVEPDARFTRRTDHELYCAGHLMEAAVAYYEATGKDKFLNVMCRYADLIEKVFVKEKTSKFITPGHEEIELALVKLFHCTKEKRYLELSKFFIDSRGTAKEDYYPWAKANYAQDHLPVREQTTAEGHAVRAVYLYCAMADLAYEYNDTVLYSACKRIFENIICKRMYITGGIGSSSHGEAFTKDYDLPNITAYSESCAALGLALFASRMNRLEPNSTYGDIIEKVIYNGFLSSISLDGKSFFYENPLEVNPNIIDKDTSITAGGDRYPITQRQEIFSCSCCPPNITRFIASIGNLLYTINDDTIYIHHYMESETNTNINGASVMLRQKTSYPYDGKILFEFRSDKALRLAFRIPGWCSDYSLRLNGNPADYQLKDGFAYITADDKATIELHFDMEVIFMESIPYVQENAGRYAIQRGPVIYCLEGVDNGEFLRDIRLSTNSEYKLNYDEYLGVPVLLTKGKRRNLEQFHGLYRSKKNDYIDCDCKLIPYFAFANRGESEMVVWVQLEDN